MWQEDQITDTSAVMKLLIYTTIAATQTTHQIWKSPWVGGCYFRSVALGTIQSTLSVYYKACENGRCHLQVQRVERTTKINGNKTPYAFKAKTNKFTNKPYNHWQTMMLNTWSQLCFLYSYAFWTCSPKSNSHLHTEKAHNKLQSKPPLMSYCRITFWIFPSL